MGIDHGIPRGRVSGDADVAAERDAGTARAAFDEARRDEIGCEAFADAAEVDVTPAGMVTVPRSRSMRTPSHPGAGRDGGAGGPLGATRRKVRS